MSIQPHIQKLPLNDHSSFVARTYRTPNFEVGWHKHPEVELILFKEGSGLSFIGNHIGSFSKGDIYLIGANVPHTFQKNGEQVTSAVVVQFLPEAFGPHFFSLPESRRISTLLEASLTGLAICGNPRKSLGKDIAAMEQQQGMPRLLNLLGCLELIATQKCYRELNLQAVLPQAEQDTRIDDIFRYTIAAYRDRITLATVADMAHLSVPAFCSWFKKVTKKTYVEFLHEIRISYACDLLTTTAQSISEIAYACGFTHAGHFHKQFLRYKGLSPLQYRKTLTAETLNHSANIYQAATPIPDGPVRKH